MDKITRSCSPRCWFARGEICKCICDGKNHQLNKKDVDPELLEKMEEMFKQYKGLRRQERKLSRTGISSKPLSQETKKLMNQIVKAYKKR